MLAEQQVALDGADLGTLTGTLWSEPVIPTDATVIATYTDGPSAGFAAITRVVRVKARPGTSAPSWTRAVAPRRRGLCGCP